MTFLNFDLSQIGVLKVELFSGFYKEVVGSLW